MEEQKSQGPHIFDSNIFDPRYLSHKGIYTIPEGVTEIAESRFRGQIGLESINIPGSVKRIGDDAFLYYENLKHVTLHEGLEVIGDYAFYAFFKSGLESINIPRSVKRIGRGAFWLRKPKACQFT